MKELHCIPTLVKWNISVFRTTSIHRLSLKVSHKPRFFSKTSNNNIKYLFQVSKERRLFYLFQLKNTKQIQWKDSEWWWWLVHKFFSNIFLLVILRMFKKTRSLLVICLNVQLSKWTIRDLVRIQFYTWLLMDTLAVETETEMIKL